MIISAYKSLSEKARSRFFVTPNKINEKLLSSIKHNSYRDIESGIGSIILALDNSTYEIYCEGVWYTIDLVLGYQTLKLFNIEYCNEVLEFLGYNKRVDYPSEIDSKAKLMLLFSIGNFTYEETLLKKQTYDASSLTHMRFYVYCNISKFFKTFLTTLIC